MGKTDSVPCMSKNLAFVIGGAASGKSKWAEDFALGQCALPVYVATARPIDKEMAAKIALHRQRRGSSWQTVECPVELHRVVERYDSNSLLLIECLPTWTTNLLVSEVDTPDYHRRFLDAARTCQCRLIVVSGEVGCGIVPDNALAREFTRLLGNLNQRLAVLADLVVSMKAGLPVVIKGKIR